MTKIILATHGTLCSALLETAQMIVGEIPEVAAAPLLQGDAPEDYMEQLRRLRGPEGQENTIFLCDLAGGTPYNCTVRISDGTPPLLLTGVSLPMLLSALELREDFSGEALLDEIQAAAIAGIRRFQTGRSGNVKG